MLLLTKINVWKQVSKEKQQVSKEVCLQDWFNWNNNDVVDLSSSSWSDNEDKN